MGRAQSLQGFGFGAPSTPSRATQMRSSDIPKQVRQLSPARATRTPGFNRNSSDNVAAVLGGYSTSPTRQASRPATHHSATRPVATPKSTSFRGQNVSKDEVTCPPFDCKVLQSAGKTSSIPISLTAGAGSTQGLRPTMEDAHLAWINAGNASDGQPVSLFAVLDGHCGRRVADLGSHFLPEAVLSRPSLGTDNATALVEAVVQTDKAIFQQMGRADGGSTLIAALIHNRMLFIANLGDAREVLYDGTTIAMSVDHKPTDAAEQQRIIRCGSFVHFGRVGACLAVSRALGDYEFKFSSSRYGTEKEFAVSHIPDIRQINITDTTKFLILACDGLWDVCSNEEATAFVNSFMSSADTRDFQKALNLCSSQLAMHAVERGSMDNVTVLLLWFHQPEQSTSTMVASSNSRPASNQTNGIPPRASSGVNLTRTAPVGTRLPSLGGSTPKTRGNL